MTINGYIRRISFYTAYGLLIAAALSTAYGSSPADNHYFIGIVGGVHDRDGYYNFGNNRIEHVHRNTLPSIGLTAGKNIGLPFGIRIALPLQFDYGKACEDTVEDLIVEGENKPLALYSQMYHLGLEPLLQFPFRLAPRVWAYGAAGGGIHYVAMSEELRIIDDPQNRRVEGDPRLESDAGACFSAAAEGGIEITLAPPASLFFHYTFRFWQPVRRASRRDLFPLDPQAYAERFFTHAISIGVLFARER